MVILDRGLLATMDERQLLLKLDQMVAGAMQKVALKVQAEDQEIRQQNAKRIRELESHFQEVGLTAIRERRVPEKLGGPAYPFSLTYYFIEYSKILVVLVAFTCLASWIGARKYWQPGLYYGHKIGMYTAAHYSHDHPNAWKAFVRSMKPNQ